MEAVCKVNQSTGLEKTITVVRGNASLGMTVSALRDGLGISIRSVANEGAISKDGRLKVGDGILALNEEATINLTTAQARAMLRKHSLIGPELSVTYVPAAFLDMHRAIQSKQDVKASRATVIQSKQALKLNQATVIQSENNIKLGQATVIRLKEGMNSGQADVVQTKKEMNLRQATVIQLKQGTTIGCSTAAQGHKTPATTVTQLKCIPEQSKEEGGRAIEKTCWKREKGQAENMTRLRCSDHEERKEKQQKGARDRDPLLSLQAEGWRKDETEKETEEKRHRSDEQTWSHPRRVTLIRTNRESLGISVIGGRGMGCRLSNGEMRRGIFIKHITENSPAARDNTLTAGDRIIQVGGLDVTDFTHEEAVEAIRQAGDKVELLVQSSQLSEKRLLRAPLTKPTPPSSSLHSDVTSKIGVKRQCGPSESEQHCQHGQKSYWDHMLQKYGSLPDELKLVKLDCSTRRPGLGVCVPTALQPDGADEQIRVRDEQFEINEQILDRQNADSVINSASSEVKLVLIRNKAAPKHTATGSVIKAENTVITSPAGVNKEHKQAATINQERMRLDKQQPHFSNTSNNPLVSFITLSNHNPRNTAASHIYNTHHKRSYCSSLTSSSAIQSSPYCSACSVRSDPLTRPIIPGCINIIDICKGHSSLGLSIIGGCNTSLGVILIHEVNEGGAAHRDGRLMAGDHLLEVNGIDLRMASHEEALSVLRLSPQHVRLCVYRHTSIHTFQTQATHTHEDMWDLFTVDLQLQPGQELGLNIVGKRNDTGIFVSEIIRGGVVESDGRLSLGDQILSVNGEDIRAVTQDYACSLLQSCSGSVLLEVARFTATPHYSYEFQVGEAAFPCSPTPASCLRRKLAGNCE